MGSIEEKDGKILIPEADYLNILKTASGDSTDDCHLSRGVARSSERGGAVEHFEHSLVDKNP